MIVDTNVWIDYFLGKSGEDLELFRTALNEGRVVMAPAVLSELLISTEMTGEVEKALSEMPIAMPAPDFWKETGKLRRRLAQQGTNATLADCLVVQSCLEHGFPLLTRDKGIKKFGAKVGLLLV
ncbi:PIN domain-containing protein [Bdellovibrionota bacterium FG-1]